MKQAFIAILLVTSLFLLGCVGSQTTQLELANCTSQLTATKEMVTNSEDIIQQLNEQIDTQNEAISATTSKLNEADKVINAYRKFELDLSKARTVGNSLQASADALDISQDYTTCMAWAQKNYDYFGPHSYNGFLLRINYYFILADYINDTDCFEKLDEWNKSNEEWLPLNVERQVLNENYCYGYHKANIYGSEFTEKYVTPVTLNNDKIDLLVDKLNDAQDEVEAACFG